MNRRVVASATMTPRPVAPAAISTSTPPTPPPRALTELRSPCPRVSLPRRNQSQRDALSPRGQYSNKEEPYEEDRNRPAGRRGRGTDRQRKCVRRLHQQRIYQLRPDPAGSHGL